jgi:hypothetical protein
MEINKKKKKKKKKMNLGGEVGGMGKSISSISRSIYLLQSS